jgi:malate dehydrogenase (quinone)
MMKGRAPEGPLAMTRSDDGTDVNFGKLAHLLFQALEARGAGVHLGHDVRGLAREQDGRWRVEVKDVNSGRVSAISSRFVFIGAGGRAISLLQESGIKEAKGYAGFPVGGQFLRCTNPDLIAAHRAKVYGKSTVDAPPMAMPHLDTRVVNGRRGLLFGPYAGFSPKFLKRGSWTDMIRSVRPNNILTILSVAKDEFPLTKFLVRQVLQSHEDRIETLRDFVPTARPEDWELIHAGQRVQTMKRVKGLRGGLVFGTEVVTGADGTIAALLGASPGASVSPSIMLEVMQRCFPDDYRGWEPRLREMIPSLGVTLANEPRLYDEIQAFTTRTLGLVGAPGTPSTEEVLIPASAR